MPDPVKRFIALCVGALALIRDALRRRKLGPQGASVLRQLAAEKSASILDLSSRAKVTEPAALSILIELEEQGLVRLSADKGAEHVRIAAITDAGRQELARLG